MTTSLPDRIDPDAPIFVISVAAQLAEMHPQTLRGYDRLGLVVPGRSRGRGRRYSLRDIAKLRHIQHLSQAEGINLEGIRRILALESQLEDLQLQIAQLTTLVEHLHLSGGETRLFTSTQTGEVHLGRVRPHTPRALTR
jgi:MerR family transcriptional regulator/heat shock protein HspR